MAQAIVRAVNLSGFTQQINAAAKRAWALTLNDLVGWTKSKLIPAMVFGGMGIKGINSTPFYLFISSPGGLSQLGIPASEPPKLLNAYLKDATKVSIKSGSLLIEFGDEAKLRVATPHPATGTGNLHIESWMEWVFDGSIVDRGFVPRTNIPNRVQKHIRLSSPLGGLMLPMGALGSTGLWKFPSSLSSYSQKWFAENQAKIIAVLNKQTAIFFQRRLASG